MVEWVEWLGYGADGPGQALVQGWASLGNDWKTLSVNPAVNGYLFLIEER